MTSVEAALRGGAIALLALLAIAALRDARHSPVDRYSALFDVCAIAFLIETAPDLKGSGAWWILPPRLLSNMAPGVFLVWARAQFTDGFVPHWKHWLPAIGMLVLTVGALALDRPLAWRMVEFSSLMLAGAGIYLVLAGRGQDLVEQRRRARVLFAAGIGLWIAVTNLVTTTAAPGVVAAGVLGIALAAALLRLRLHIDAGTAVSTAPSAPVPPEPVDPLDPEDQALQERLCRIMQQDRAYRDAGLTVADLAGRLGLPEYRLRRLINRRLGYRNFSSFVNGYRLAEARAALADPAQVRVPVLTIALDAGFQSIGPFNRAFKLQTGDTPTDYRRKRLAGLADSEIG